MAGGGWGGFQRCVVAVQRKIIQHDVHYIDCPLTL